MKRPKSSTNQRRANECDWWSCNFPYYPRALGRSSDIGDRAIAEARSGRIPIGAFLLPLRVGYLRV